MENLKCIQCNKNLTGKQEKFCSHKCNDLWWLTKKLIEIDCSKCGKLCRVSIHSKRKMCRSCINKEPCRHRVLLSGDKNPNWRGGHEYWQEGRHGRDKDGLSWKSQRKLAWERDKYTCQICGKHEDGWKPNVHHINPFRFSFSHALENLICLCPSCHHREEAKIKELWGGKTFGGYIDTKKTKKIKPQCVKCGKIGVKLNKDIECIPCFYEKNYPIICNEYKTNKSIKQLMEKYKVSQRTIYYWLKGIIPKFRGKTIK